MIPELGKLTTSEVELMYKAPILVCILIAGADGKIDRKEIKVALDFAEARQRKSLSPVSVFFKEVSKDFEDKLKSLIQSYPYETTQRNPLIVEELSGLSQIWRKVDQSFATEFYQTLLTIAEKIATSSGGVLGYNSVGSEEARFIKLGMIKNPSGGH